MDQQIAAGLCFFTTAAIVVLTRLFCRRPGVPFFGRQGQVWKGARESLTPIGAVLYYLAVVPLLAGVVLWLK